MLLSAATVKTPAPGLLQTTRPGFTEAPLFLFKYSIIFFALEPVPEAKIAIRFINNFSSSKVVTFRYEKIYSSIFICSDKHSRFYAEAKLRRQAISRPIAQ